MTAGTVCRYMSLAKYVDVLRSRSIFCPKASLFPDQTEGKWVAHAVLWGERQQWMQGRTNAERLQAVIRDGAGDQDRILQEANRLYTRLDGKEKKSVLGDVLRSLQRVYPHKREEYLQRMVGSWIKHHDGYNDRVQEWKRQVAVDRESTYVSCWTRAESMSLAMWNLYGGGVESVAIRSDADRLEALVAANRPWLRADGFDADVVDVEYVEGLNQPDEELRSDLVQRLNLGEDVRVGAFSVKPAMYAYENEVRVIIHTVRGTFDSVIDPSPDLDGISLSIGQKSDQTGNELSTFIEAVYVHPMLDATSMTVRVVKAINERFGLPELPIITDKIEAIGHSMALEPVGRAGSSSNE